MTLSIEPTEFRLAGTIASHAAAYARENGWHDTYTTVHPEVAISELLAINNSSPDGFGSDHNLSKFYRYHIQSYQQALLALRSNRSVPDLNNKLHDPQEPRPIETYLGPENILQAPNFDYLPNSGLITVIQGFETEAGTASAYKEVKERSGKKIDADVRVPAQVFIDFLIEKLTDQLKPGKVGVAMIADIFSDEQSDHVIPLLSRSVGRGSPYTFGVVYEKARTVAITGRNSNPSLLVEFPKVSPIRGGKLLSLTRPKTPGGDLSGEVEEKSLIVAVGGLDQFEDVNVINEAVDLFNSAISTHMLTLAGKL